jgi:radical SAM-linked protein
MPAIVAPGERLAGSRAWGAILAATGLPVADASSSRGRVVPAAALPLGVAGEREIVDVMLADLLPASVVRAAVEAALPPSWKLVDLHDVWLGAPSAPAMVVAAEYRALVTGPSPAALDAAARALLAARALPRERIREKRTTSYDLRPLLLDLAVRGAGVGGVSIGLRLRHGVDLVGRPDEVLAALAEPPSPPLGAPLATVEVVRERLILADEPGAPAPGDQEPAARK